MGCPFVAVALAHPLLQNVASEPEAAKIRLTRMQGRAPGSLYLGDLLHSSDEACTVGLHKPCKIGSIQVRRRTAGVLENPRHVGIRGGFPHRLAELGHDRIQERAWREQTGPDVELHVRIADLLEGRQVREARDALRPQLARMRMVTASTCSFSTPGAEASA
jgi:hypothetical protein